MPYGRSLSPGGSGGSVFASANPSNPFIGTGGQGLNFANTARPAVKPADPLEDLAHKLMNEAGLPNDSNTFRKTVNTINAFRKVYRRDPDANNIKQYAPAFETEQEVAEDLRKQPEFFGTPEGANAPFEDLPRDRQEQVLGQQETDAKDKLIKDINDRWAKANKDMIDKFNQIQTATLAKMEENDLRHANDATKLAEKKRAIMRAANTKLNNASTSIQDRTVLALDALKADTQAKLRSDDPATQDFLKQFAEPEIELTKKAFADATVDQAKQNRLQWASKGLLESGDFLRAQAELSQRMSSREGETISGIRQAALAQRRGQVTGEAELERQRLIGREATNLGLAGQETARELATEQGISDDEAQSLLGVQARQNALAGQFANLQYGAASQGAEKEFDIGKLGGQLDYGNIIAGINRKRDDADYNREIATANRYADLYGDKGPSTLSQLGGLATGLGGLATGIGTIAEGPIGIGIGSALGGLGALLGLGGGGSKPNPLAGYASTRKGRPYQAGKKYSGAFA